jgi:hypothetical protein
LRRSRCQLRSGWLRCISSSTVTGRTPGRVISGGRMSLSQRPPSGSATWRRSGRGRGLVQHVFHLPAWIPAGSPRGQIVRRAAKRKTLFIITC